MSKNAKSPKETRLASKKSISQSTAAAQTEREQQEFAKQYKARKWTEYDRRNAELREAKPDREQRYIAIISELHDYHKNALWFAENTPYPFRVKFHPTETEIIASATVRNLCEIARHGNESAIRDVARLAITLCECLDELLARETPESDHAAELMRWESERLPYWPFLQTTHTAGRNHFPRLAEKLQLGKESWLSVSESSLYSLQTPRNRYLWRTLRLFQEAHDIIERELKASQRGEADYWPKLAHWTVMSNVEKDIARKSFNLGRPTKANASDWIDQAIMPFINERETDFQAVPEFISIAPEKRYPKRYQQRKAIRKALLEGLMSIAPEE